MLKLAKLNGNPEIFYSIQGEGKNIGRPSIFIRLSLCNLYCNWCDTDYTWNWEGTPHPHQNDQNPAYKKYQKELFMMELSNKEIIRQIDSFNCKNLVITGGEPLMQQKELISLLNALKETDKTYHIEFETNGTTTPSKGLDIQTDQYNVSLKLSNSKVKEKDRLNEQAVTFFAQSPKANFKFVVDRENDLHEILALIKQYNISPEQVYLMPQGTNPEILRQKQQWLIELCKQYGFNFTDRLHIHIYGNKRGV